MLAEEKMKHIKLLLIAAISLCSIYAGKLDKKNIGVPFKEIKIRVHNPLNVARKDKTISVDIDKLKAKYADFNFNTFIVYSNNKEVPSQTACNNSSAIPDQILFLINLKPNETKTITIKYSQSNIKKKEYKKRTDAYLGKKVDYKIEKGFYTGGKFVSVHSEKVQEDHFAHDALYQFEGPGWESDLIAYRYYLDSRNRNDITGKKTHDMIIRKMGVNDLVSNSAESYTKMLDWGMDIFKVGESLGIGSIAMWYDNKVNTLNDLRKEECKITADGPISADILTKYLGWKVGNEKFNLTSNLSINAGSRLTKVSLNLKDKNAVMCTGLAKHEDCKLLKSNSKKNLKWGYIGLYGKQSLAGDDLGIALFYKLSNLNKVTEDSLSHIVVLNPAKGKLFYYFAAAWEQEPDGIKDINEFKAYLDKTILKLSEPVKINF